VPHDIDRDRGRDQGVDSTVAATRLGEAPPFPYESRRGCEHVVGEALVAGVRSVRCPRSMP
jgi:hypothetical protein